MMEAVIFDLDGTLWDACENTAIAWNIYVREHCPDTKVEVTPKALESCMGLLLEEFGSRIFTDVPKERSAQIAVACAKAENAYLAANGADIYDGVEETLKALSEKYKLFIVSNCQSGYIETFLSYYHLEPYIADTLCPGDSGEEKAENIVQIMKKNQVKKAVYVGDTIKDFNESQKAGVPFIWASYGFGTVEGTAKIESIRELPEAIEKLEK